MMALSSSFIPTPLAHADNQRDSHRGGRHHNGTQMSLKQDNAGTHTFTLAGNFRKAEAKQRMEYPTCSPDLNPIKHA
ncbi:hypothetical protein TNCV_2842241 [Trichonephila clavipes]|nr:hypothetical protein TNCV_2842241 [Trichonephila clavipes]